MAILSLDAIKPGMVLAGDVKDRNGRALLSAGAEITEKHIRIFKMWGIHSAPIQGEDKENAPSNRSSEIDPNLLHEAERKTAERFYHNDLNHPFIRELFRLVTLESLYGPEEQSRGS